MDEIEKQNQLQKVLKTKQITIEWVKIKININTNWQDTFNF
jgi:hypothetical protein